MTRYCEECNKLVDATKKVMKITHQVKGVDITINAEVMVCGECGEEVSDEETNNEILRRIYSEYRSIKGLLQPHEIKRVRDRYGVSQVVFAKILGLGDKTIARYENGSIQDEAQNNLILLADNPENFLKLLEKNKVKLTENELLQVIDRHVFVTLPDPVVYCLECSAINYDFGTIKRIDSTIVDRLGNGAIAA
jgi:putative zinc finger/helix-turn-helix YgiT family protein